MVVSQKMGRGPIRRGKQWLNGVQYPNFFGHIHIHAQNMFWNIQIDCIHTPNMFFARSIGISIFEP